jgi:predicted alpha/beta hydrolase family esterase
MAAVAGILLLAGCTSGGVAPSPADGPRQAVWCVGDKGAPGVVLIAGIGNGATSNQWKPVADLLTKDFHVCAYDRPGMGKSRAPDAAGRGAAELTAELDEVVDKAGGDRVILVAHSFGGYLARIYAHEHASRVAGVVFVDALDPSVGIVGGTGASDLDSVQMGNEHLDLADVEAAATDVTSLDVPIAVVSRDKGVSAAWEKGQHALAGLSSLLPYEVTAHSGHQVPTEDPAAVVEGVHGLPRTVSG